MATSTLIVQAREVQRHHRATLAQITGFFFGFRACITLLLFRSDPALGTAATLAASLTLLAISTAHWLAITPIERKHYRTPAPVCWVAIYLALALVSFGWSLTPSISVALAYWLGMAADVLIVVLLLSSPTGKGMLDDLLAGYFGGAVFVAAVAWCLPVMQDLRLGDEDFLHPNAIGFEFAIAVLCSIYLAARYAWAKWAGAFLAITLLRTLSKASIIAFTTAAGYWFIKDRDISSRAKAKIGMVLGTVLLLSWGLLEAYAEIYSQGAQSETLTGRTLIWSTALDMAAEKPWLGHGFYSFRWLVPPFHNFEPWQAHNELLQQFFCYGIAGVLVTIALYWAIFRQTDRHTSGRLARLSTAILIFAVIRGLVDTERFDLSFPLWLLSALSITMAKTASP